MRQKYMKHKVINEKKKKTNKRVLNQNEKQEKIDTKQNCN